MRIIERTQSSEQCAEAGWTAYDYHTDSPITRNFILSLRPLGSFLFMERLAKPFFKIEADLYVIKGVLGDSFFRIAFHRDAHHELQRLEGVILAKHFF